MADAAQIIAVDWGTTSFRAYLATADGRVLDRAASDKGILAVQNQRFADVLAGATKPWLQAHGPLPIVLSGMIGSRQGWVEAPYVKCPADTKALAQRLTTIEVEGIGAVRLVPGLETRGADQVPDVMRGEEAQVLGALQPGGARDGLFVLPGTHSKWVTAKGGTITGFRTYMTGEVFAALRGHTILGRLMTPKGGSGSGFAKGVAAGSAPGGAGELLNRVFAVRTFGLLGEVPPPELADYLSGILIGAELASASAQTKGAFTLVAGAELSDRYKRAAELLGLKAAVASAESVVLGQLAIARVAGLLGRA